MTDQPPDVAFSHKLRVAILNGKAETVEEITFRKPRAGDIMRCGFPIKHAPGQAIETAELDGQKMGLMMAALSGIPLGMIERMDPNDMTECAWGLARFFIFGMGSQTAA